MAPKLPFMPFYGSDFYDDEKVRLMDLEDEAIYLRLLWMQWREGSLPANPTDLGILARADVTEQVAACFPLSTDGRRRNPKLERIRVEHTEIRERLSEAGKRGRAKQLLPRGGPGQAHAGIAQPLLGESESETDTESHTTLPPPKKNNNGTPPSGGWTAQWARIYGHHVGVMSPGRIGKACAVLRAKYGPDRSEEMWTLYCRQRRFYRFGEFDPKHNDLKATTPEDFAQTAQHWFDLTKPMAHATT
jgi:hypothetical protein